MGRISSGTPVLGIVGQFGFLLGVEVIQVAEELVEAVHGGQMLVAVAEVVLAELAGGVALRLQCGGDGRVLRLQAEFGAGHADLGQASAVGVLAGDEGRPACGAALLPVVVGETHSLGGDAVDVGGLITHHPVAVATEVALADVIAPDEPLVVVARSTARPDTGPPLVPGFDARKTDARPDPLPRTVNSSRYRCECQNAGSLGSVSQGSGVGGSAAAGRWSSRSVRTRVPNCGSRRELPETPLRVCGIRWRPVSRALASIFREMP